MRKIFLNIFLLLIGMFICNITVNAYKLGNIIDYNGNTYYVISDNGEYLTLIKQKPLTKDEINKYGVGHINNRTKYKSGDPTLDRIYEKEVVEDDGIPKVAFYQSEGCGYDIEPINTDCKNNYNISEVKYIVDAWASDNVEQNDLVNDKTGLSVRLLTTDELKDIFGYSYQKESISSDEYIYKKSEDTPKWIYNYDYDNSHKHNYWTMSAANDGDGVYEVKDDGIIENLKSNYFSQIRPVISILKYPKIPNNKTYYIDSNSYRLPLENEYNIGDVIYYNDIKFIVAEKSNSNDKYITLIKDTPLTVEEVEKNGQGYINTGLETEGIPKNVDGYGSVTYYSSLNCNESDKSMCTNNYDDSNVKHIIDNWVKNNMSKGVHSSRIINKNEIEDELKYIKYTKFIDGTRMVFLYYPYRNKTFGQTGWTEYSYVDTNYCSMASDKEGVVSLANVYDYNVIKPVIILEKTTYADGNTVVEVPDTKMYKGIMIIISGFVIAGLSIMFVVINKKYKKR